MCARCNADRWGSRGSTISAPKRKRRRVDARGLHRLQGPLSKRHGDAGQAGNHSGHGKPRGCCDRLAQAMPHFRAPPTTTRPESKTPPPSVHGRVGCHYHRGLLVQTECPIAGVSQVAVQGGRWTRQHRTSHTPLVTNGGRHSVEVVEEPNLAGGTGTWQCTGTLHHRGVMRRGWGTQSPATGLDRGTTMSGDRNTP